MPEFEKLNEIIARLELTTPLETEHFRIYYWLRNPEHGRGEGSHGVGDIRLIEAYKEGLEELYAHMTRPPFSRTAPPTDNSGKAPVYVLDMRRVQGTRSSPLADQRVADSMPFICLPSRSHEPTQQQWLDKARADATHEATHLFNLRERPRLSYDEPGRHQLDYYVWHWLHEAFAVYMEMRVWPNIQDHSRFALDWVDYPDLPLDRLPYQAGFFVCYLVKRYGVEILNDLWVTSARNETPFQALERLVGAHPAGDVFGSHDPEISCLFATQYCRDAFFLSEDPACLLPSHLFPRHGQRAIRESFSLSPGASERRSEQLDHLACRYYRLYPRRGTRQIEVTLRTPRGGDAHAPIRAELVAVGGANQPQEISALRPSNTAASASPVELRATWTAGAEDEPEYLVLIVVNCGTVKGRDDNRPYELEIVAG